jgi:putative peptide zinc metalloprotease protein
MADLNPLSSPQWHRVANLQPALSPQVDIARIWLRGQRWYVLHHREHGQRCRLNQQAYDIAARLDGQRTIDSLWQALDGPHRPTSAPEPPSQEDMIQVLGLLIKHHLLNFERAPDFGTLLPTASDAKPATTDHPVKKPRNTLWSWRQSLGNPAPWLDRHAHWAQRLFSVGGLALWALLMAVMVGAWIVHASALKDHAQTWMHTPSHLLLSLLLYPLIKLVHEAAHALAVRRWGGEVTECGVTLMMLMPVPYVDASAAHGFTHSWQRIVVSAAGIMAELALAALGMWLWIASDPGWLHNTGFVIWFIACTSTLLFNGNPLQRLDGYHVLIDALQMPNLAMRSRHWWGQSVQRWVLDEPRITDRLDAAPFQEDERLWLWCYAPLAWVYQLCLWAGLSLWLGSLSTPLGWAMAAASAWMLLLMPAVSWTRMLWRAALNSRSGHTDSPAFKRLAWLLGMPLVLLLAPMPDRTLVQGVVWAPDKALVRAEVDGFVLALDRPDGAMVQVGEVLAQLDNPRLSAQRDRIAAELARAQQSQFTYLGVDGSKAGQAVDEATKLQGQLERIEEQLASLQIRAQRPGRLVWPRADDMPGHYVRRGELIGHILDRQPATVRVAMAQDEVPLLSQHTRAASVRLSDPRSHAQPATLIRDSIGATLSLPSAALSDAMGGDITTDPKDDKHLRTLRPVVLMDLQLDTPASDDQPTRLGERAWVRLSHGWSPLLWQAGRWVQQQALRVFNPQR